jgi:hypothetical protein
LYGQLIWDAGGKDMGERKILYCILGVILISVIAIRIYNSNSRVLRGCNNKELGEVIRFSDVYNKDSSKIIKLRMRSGANFEAYETEDKADIEEFIHLISAKRFTKQENQEPSGGWTYYIDLIESSDEKNWLRINFSRINFVRYAKRSNIKSSPYYDMENREEFLKELNRFYELIKVNGIKVD